MFIRDSQLIYNGAIIHLGYVTMNLHLITSLFFNCRPFVLEVTKQHQHSECFLNGIIKLIVVKLINPILNPQSPRLFQETQRHKFMTPARRPLTFVILISDRHI